MSKMAAATFLKRLAEERDLQKTLKASAAQCGDPVAATIELGEEQGYEFTAVEFAQTINLLARGELSDRDLEVVAGGASAADTSEQFVLPLDEIKFTYTKVDWTSATSTDRSAWQIEGT